MNILLVIDIQKEFAKNSKYYEVLDFVKISAYKYDLVIGTRFVSGNTLFQQRLNLVFEEIADDIEYLADKIIDKKGYGLTEDDYVALKENYPNAHYDIVGCESDACVYKIAMDMFDRGFSFDILRDYIYSDLSSDILNILERNIGLS